MKQTLILPLTIIILWGCNNMKDTTKTETVRDTIQVPMVGNDADEHGCKASAGYTWSAVKKDCIRVWETGIQLQPIDNQPFSGSVVLGEDQKEAELFIVNVAGSTILKATDGKKDAYSSKDGYEFSKDEKGWLLKKDGKVIYRN